MSVLQRGNFYCCALVWLKFNIIMKGVAHCGKIMIAKLIVFLTIVDHNVSTSVLLVFNWGWCQQAMCQYKKHHGWWWLVQLGCCWLEDFDPRNCSTLVANVVWSRASTLLSLLILSGWSIMWIISIFTPPCVPNYVILNQ